MAGKPATLDAPENDETYLRFASDRFYTKSLPSVVLFFFFQLFVFFLFFRNLKFAAEQLESTGIIGVIEPINNYSVPGYYLNNYEKGVIRTCEDNALHNLLIMLVRLLLVSNVRQCSYFFPLPKCSCFFFFFSIQKPTENTSNVVETHKNARKSNETLNSHNGWPNERANPAIVLKSLRIS